MSGILPAWLCRLSRPKAALGLALLAMSIIVGLSTGVTKAERHANGTRPGDSALYLSIIDRVAAGESYYSAATEEQRRLHYPLKPVFAVREPLLAIAMAALPNENARVQTLRILTIFVLIAWGWRLGQESKKWMKDDVCSDLSENAVVSSVRFLLVLIGLLFLSFGVLAGFTENGYLLHEVWAGDLMMLALALYHPRQWGWSLAIGLLAAVTRELAAPFLLVMGMVALFERRWRESAAWGTAILIFAIVMLVHAHALAAYVRPEDLASSGWVRFGGWPYVLLVNAYWHGLLVSAPQWLIAVAVPLMLLGSAAFPGETGKRLMLLCFGYCAGFFVLGRPDNVYWGLIAMPAMALSLAAFPAGLCCLFCRLFRGRVGIERL